MQVALTLRTCSLCNVFCFSSQTFDSFTRPNNKLTLTPPNPNELLKQKSTRSRFACFASKSNPNAISDSSKFNVGGSTSFPSKPPFLPLSLSRTRRSPPPTRPPLPANAPSLPSSTTPPVSSPPRQKRSESRAFPPCLRFVFPWHAH